MTIDADKLLRLEVPEVEHAYSEKDAILYALGVGLGHDPMNEAELAFVYEKELKVLPTFACVLWMSPPASAGTSSGEISVDRIDSSVFDACSSNCFVCTTHLIRY